MERNHPYAPLPARHPADGVDFSSLLNTPPPFANAATWGHLQQTVRSREPPGFSYAPQMQHFLGAGTLPRQPPSQIGPAAPPAFRGPVYPVQQAVRDTASCRSPSSQHRSPASSQLPHGVGCGPHSPGQPTGMPQTPTVEPLGHLSTSLGPATAYNMGWAGPKNSNTHSLGSPVVANRPTSTRPFLTTLLEGLNEPQSNFSAPSLLADESLKSGDDAQPNGNDRLVAELMREGPTTSQDARNHILPTSSSNRPTKAPATQPLLMPPPTPQATPSSIPPPQQVRGTHLEASPSQAVTPQAQKPKSHKRSRGGKVASRKGGGKVTPSATPAKNRSPQTVVDFFQDIDPEELEIDFDEYTFWDLNLSKELNRERPPRKRLAQSLPDIATDPLPLQDDSRSAKLLRWAFGQHVPSKWFQ